VLDMRALEALPRPKPWLPLVPPPLVPSQDWSVVRINGVVDERLERERVQRLLALYPADAVLVRAGLRHLDRRPSWEPVSGTPPGFEQEVQRAVAAAPKPLTKLKHDNFEKLLVEHPDRLAVALLLDAIRNGTNIQYSGPRDAVAQPAARQLTEDVVEFLRDDVQKEQKAGHTSAFASEPQFSNLRVSPVYRVPKTENGIQTGWRRITDASSPAGSSVNDFIERLLCRVISFDQAVELIRLAGAGCWLAKIDAKGAFRQVWVRPQDWHLMGITVDGRFAFDYVLSFGLRSSPPMWDRVASALCWVLNEQLSIVSVYHVDDMLLIVPKNADAAAKWRQALQLFDVTGTVVAQDKLVEPATSVVYCGVLINTVQMTLSVTEERKAQCISVISSVRDRKRVSLKRLQKLAGKLAFLTRVIPPGRVVLNRVLGALRAGEAKSVPVTDDLRADLDWWLRFLPGWKGVSAIPASSWVSCAQLEFFTDASKTFGMGAVMAVNRVVQGQQRAVVLWMSERWHRSHIQAAEREKDISVPYLELLSVATAVATWREELRGKRIIVQCDCLPVVQALNRGTTHSPEFAALLRAIVGWCIDVGCELRAAHTPGYLNVWADGLSRGNVQDFLASCSAASPSPSPPPRSTTPLNW
jgi:hypothetical protein